MPAEVGAQLGDYRLLDLIGSRGMGTVYLAENVHHRKRYAVKVLPESLARHWSLIARSTGPDRPLPASSG